MSSRGYRPPALTAEQLRKLVLDAIQKAPDYANPETFHALFEHLERGLSTDDVIHGLERAWTLRSWKFNETEWQWKYMIAAESVDGGAITIIIAVDSLRREFTVVTRWKDDDDDA